MTAEFAILACAGVCIIVAYFVGRWHGKEAGANEWETMARVGVLLEQNREIAADLQTSVDKLKGISG